MLKTLLIALLALSGANAQQGVPDTRQDNQDSTLTRLTDTMEGFAIEAEQIIAGNDLFLRSVETMEKQGGISSLEAVRLLGKEERLEQTANKK